MRNPFRPYFKEDFDPLFAKRNDEHPWHDWPFMDMSIWFGIPTILLSLFFGDGKAPDDWVLYTFAVFLVLWVLTYVFHFGLLLIGLPWRHGWDGPKVFKG